MSDRLLNLEAGECVHFTGIQNKQCRASMTYPEGPLPCFKDERAAPCPSYQEPTPEQIAQCKAELDEHMAKFRTVMGVVATWRTWTKKNRVGKQEIIECPACKGRLHLTQAAYNGHVHGQCETKGCVSWME